VIPYRLPELIAAPAGEPVWIPEGEKDANNVAALGLIATTNPGGAKQWQPELGQWFKGKELVYILEDNDDDGRTHTAKIMTALREIVPVIAVVSFPQLPKKGDVSDWLALGGTKQLLIAYAEQARKQSTNKNYVLVRAMSAQCPVCPEVDTAERRAAPHSVSSSPTMIPLPELLEQVVARPRVNPV